MIELYLTGKQNEIRSYYKEHFYNKNDDGHNIEHADDVYGNAIKIAKSPRYNLVSMDEHIIFMMCYLHDIFVWRGRAGHNQAAAAYIMDRSDKYLEELSESQLLHVFHAVLQHRASDHTPPNSTYTQIIRLADKGKPDLFKFVRRCWKAREKNEKHDTEESLMDSVIHHVNEKIGANGYMYKDELYKEVYANEIAELIKSIDIMNDLGKESWYTYIREVTCQ